MLGRSKKLEARLIEAERKLLQTEGENFQLARSVKLLETKLQLLTLMGDYEFYMEPAVPGRVIPAKPAYLNIRSTKACE